MKLEKTVQLLLAARVSRGEISEAINHTRGPQDLPRDGNAGVAGGGGVHVYGGAVGGWVG